MPRQQKLDWCSYTLFQNFKWRGSYTDPLRIEILAAAMTGNNRLRHVRGATSDGVIHIQCDIDPTNMLCWCVAGKEANWNSNGRGWICKHCTLKFYKRKFFKDLEQSILKEIHGNRKA